MIAAEVSPASPWCQRWQDGAHSWRHTSEGGFDPARYAVEPIDELTAKRFVVEHHYSHSYPAASQRYGLFDDERLAGVCVLGIPPSHKVLTNPFPELAPFAESLELSRFVLLDECPANSETWFIARCFDEAAARGIRGVVSFADPVPRVVDGAVLFPGHVGTIYQAKGAILTGRATPETKTILRDGTCLSNRSKQKVRGQERGHEHVERKLIALGARPLRADRFRSHAEWLADALDDVGATKLRHRGAYRYCFALGTRSQRRNVRIVGTPLPYPKEVDAA